MRVSAALPVRRPFVAVAVALTFGLTSTTVAIGADVVSTQGTVSPPSVGDIVSCGVAYDAATGDASPTIALSEKIASVRQSIRYTFMNTSGATVATNDFEVAPNATTSTVPKFTVASPFTSFTCALVAAPAAAGTSGLPIVLGVVGGGLILALAAGHGGSSGSGPAPTPAPFTPTPTTTPTVPPTTTPTVTPTVTPTTTPTVAPTSTPTVTPTTTPTVAPTTTPTVAPTTTPTVAPTTTPTVAPTTTPTVAPTTTPTVAPTTTPTVAPTTTPTVAPTTAPTVAPTTTPTVAPTTAPSSAITLNPSSFQFTQSGQTGNTTASESNYTGNFTVTNAGNCSIATISPTTSAGPFTVTAQSAGSCSFTIADNHGQTTMLMVGVTTTGGTISGARRDPHPTNHHGSI